MTLLYLIDGHNLIPQVKGLDLGQMDDEMLLIERLQQFCRLSRSKAEVYFDGAPPGTSGKRDFGLVTAWFVRQGGSADNAIIERLKKMKNNARNAIVVTSDNQIQARAHLLGVKVQTSSDFASRMDSPRAVKTKVQKLDEGKSLNKDEIEQWMKLFRSGGKKDNEGKNRPKL